jgi:hypothetical protein
MTSLNPVACQLRDPGGRCSHLRREVLRDVEDLHGIRAGSYEHGAKGKGLSAKSKEPESLEQGARELGAGSQRAWSRELGARSKKARS